MAVADSHLLETYPVELFSTLPISAMKSMCMGKGNLKRNNHAARVFFRYKEIIMGIIYRIIKLASAALLSTSAFALNYVGANVPFDFTFEGKPFSVGYYDITMDSTRSFVTLSEAVPITP